MLLTSLEMCLQAAAWISTDQVESPAAQTLVIPACGFQTKWDQHDLT